MPHRHLSRSHASRSGLAHRPSRVHAAWRWVASRSLLLGALAAPPLAAVETGPDWVWWEGEEAVDTSFSERFAFAPKNKNERAVLSGDTWIGRDDKTWSPGHAEYVIDVPAAGSYAFFVRKLWQHGPFRWRFDDGAWQELTRAGSAAIDSATMRKFASVDWFALGTVDLEAGEHRLRIELLEDKRGFAAFDAFVLAPQGFVPAGTRKPGEKLGTAPEGWFAFEPDRDPYSDDALLDLGTMTGADIDRLGQIVVRDEAFVYEQSGKPVRLWSVNSKISMRTMSQPMMDRLARFVAKRGINCVRLHERWFHGSGPQAEQIDSGSADAAFYWIAALKRNGVYVAISPYFQHWLDLSKSRAFPGYDTVKNGRPFNLHFFHEPYQNVMRSWWDYILTTENPYTGIPLAEDPVLASFELINEDTFFWWSFIPDKILPKLYREDLERQFADWLKARYGSVQAAFDAWGRGYNQGVSDQPDAGRVAVYPAYNYTSKASGNRNEQRARDTAAFLVETMRDFYAASRDYLREEIGYRGPITSTTFMTADAKTMAGLVRLAQEPLQATDYHGHYRGAMERGKGWNMGEGSRYYDRSVLRLMGKQGQIEQGIDSILHRMDTAGRPLINTEFSYMLPNRYQAELAPTSAIFGRELGYDQISFFILDPTPGWQATYQGYFPVQTPTVAVQWPATAILFRGDLLREGEVLVEENVDPQAVLDLHGTAIVPAQFIDEVWAATVGKDADDFSNDDAVAQLGFDPRAFLLGKVRYDLGDDEEPGIEIHPQLDELIAGDERGMRASSGQFHWDTTTGMVRLHAAGGQGAVGFLGEAGSIELPDLRIESPMPFGSILAVAMDEQPLQESKRILLQVMSEAQNHGFEATPETGQRTIRSMGKGPIIVRNFSGTVSFAIPDADQATVIMLDANGYERERFTGAEAIELRPDVFYYLIER